jgi:hypothetical protein
MPVTPAAGGSRVALGGENTILAAMKTKAAGRTLALKPLRTSRVKSLAGCGGNVAPVVQPQPFLVHALRLRARRPLR